MNILYYYWSENSAGDIISTLIKFGYRVHKVSFTYTDYDNDPVFETELYKALTNEKIDCIFTFDFFPIISKVAQKTSIPYIAWVYDMPHNTLFSPQLKNAVNHVFLFDYVLYNSLVVKGYDCHLYHLPLPVNTARITAMLGEPPMHCGSAFDVSFVGSLYEKCLYNQIKYLPSYIKGYLDGVIEAQQKIYGYNMAEDVLNEDIVNEIKKYVKLEISEEYDMTYKELFMDMFNAKITSAERINLLRKVSEYFNVILFSGSDCRLVPNAAFGGTVDYLKEMPGVFRTSKINLNITLRSIVSGIPLRAMDIMGAGGFLVSNYQPELDELFINGEDCVLFSSEEDMLSKIEYYLSHDKERMEIACNGFMKVRDCFSHDVLVKKIFELVFGQ